MEKICAIPNCENLGESKGMNASGNTRRGRFCRMHNNGTGKAERVAFQLANPIPDQLPQPGSNRTLGRRKKKRYGNNNARQFVTNPLRVHDRINRNVPLKDDPNINIEKLEEFRRQNMYSK